MYLFQGFTADGMIRLEFDIHPCGISCGNSKMNNDCLMFHLLLQKEERHHYQKGENGENWKGELKD